MEKHEARILAMHDREIFTTSLPAAGNPVFMTPIARTFGDATTARTWDTRRKCAAA